MVSASQEALLLVLTILFWILFIIVGAGFLMSPAPEKLAPTILFLFVFLLSFGAYIHPDFVRE